MFFFFWERLLIEVQPYGVFYVRSCVLILIRCEISGIFRLENLLVFFSSTLQLAINRDYFPHTLILQSMFQHNYFFTFIRFANCTETHASASKIYLLFKRKDEAFSKRIFRCLRVLFAGEGEAHKNENRFRGFPKKRSRN